MSVLRKSLLDSVSQSLTSLLKGESDLSEIITSPYEAMAELERRQKDISLRKKVEEYFAGDIPEYFQGKPVFHLARHIVTPNFETLRFIHLIQQLGLRTVISQDTRGLFVSQNNVKRALCKLPVCLRVTQKDGKLNEQYQNISIVDFNKNDGKIFSEIQTVWGENLIHFHTRLFKELKIPVVETPDDADWLDRHGRGNLLEHYKKLLALFVVHGIFFENYNIHDEHEAHFVRDVLRPASDFIKEQFGYRPLITEIFPMTFESYQFWISYPGRVRDIIRESMHKPNLHRSETYLPFSI